MAASKEACGDAHLKTILETGELGSYETVRLAAMVAMAAGSDVIKTSTGKLPVVGHAARSRSAWRRRSASTPTPPAARWA